MKFIFHSSQCSYWNMLIIVTEICFISTTVAKVKNNDYKHNAFTPWHSSFIVHCISRRSRLNFCRKVVMSDIRLSYRLMGIELNRSLFITITVWRTYCLSVLIFLNLGHPTNQISFLFQICVSVQFLGFSLPLSGTGVQNCVPISSSTLLIDNSSSLIIRLSISPVRVWCSRLIAPLACTKWLVQSNNTVEIREEYRLSEKGYRKW